MAGTPKITLAIMFGAMLLLGPPLAALQPALAGAKFSPCPGKSSVQKIVQRWVQQCLAIPESYKSIDWSKVVEHKNGAVYKYSIRHVYSFRHPDGIEYEMDRIFMFDYRHVLMAFEEIYPQKPLYRSFHRP